MTDGEQPGESEPKRRDGSAPSETPRKGVRMFFNPTMGADAIVKVLMAEYEKQFGREES
jgi:hypothetical protein